MTKICEILQFLGHNSHLFQGKGIFFLYLQIIDVGSSFLIVGEFLHAQMDQKCKFLRFWRSITENARGEVKFFPQVVKT